MKKPEKILCAVLLTVLLCVGAYTGVSAAAGSTDPLVTLSYLTEQFTPRMEKEMEDMVTAAAADLSRQFEQAIGGASLGAGSTGTGSGVFSVVTLSPGQTLTGEVGCELMLRVGSAVCVSSGSTGLIDTTDSSTLGDGKALQRNHLYMVTISTRGVRAGEGTTKVLVRGPYTLS